MLADMVKAGKLPPVAERLPQNPLVIKPVNEIGKYGGRIRTFSPSDTSQAVELWQYGFSPLRWDNDATKVGPNACETWSTNADNTEWTLNFRKGLKWSDGQPCNVDDVMFWWNDLIQNPDFAEKPSEFGLAGGKPAVFTKVDDYTLKIKYQVPSPLTPERLAMWCKGSLGPRWIVPKHYLQQFHPAYNKSVTGWDAMTKQLAWARLPGRPTLTAWVVEEYTAGGNIRKWTRNPYYYVVDPQGNQLPYADGIDEKLISDTQAQNLSVLQGDVDFADQARSHGATLADMATFKAGEEKGGYEARLYDGGDGTGRLFLWNIDVQDKKKRDLFRTPKFKQAMSYALDRPTIQKVVYYGYGYLTTGSYSIKAVEFNFSAEAKAKFAQIRDSYVEYNPTKAKALLDEIGLKDVNGDSWREYPDGSKLELRIDFVAPGTAAGAKVLELATATWKAIGLNIIINNVSSAEFGTMWNTGKGEMRTDWEVGNGPAHIPRPSFVVPNEPSRWAPLSGNRLATLGTAKEDTELDKSPWDRQPPRFASSEKDLIGEPVWNLQQIFQKAETEVDPIKRHKMVWDIYDIHMKDGPFLLGCVGNTPVILFVSKRLGNVPTREQLATGGFYIPFTESFPANSMYPETWYLKS